MIWQIIPFSDGKSNEIRVSSVGSLALSSVQGQGGEDSEDKGAVGSGGAESADGADAREFVSGTMGRNSGWNVTELIFRRLKTSWMMNEIYTSYNLACTEIFPFSHSFLSSPKNITLEFVWLKNIFMMKKFAFFEDLLIKYI